MVCERRNQIEIVAGERKDERGRFGPCYTFRQGDKPI